MKIIEKLVKGLIKEKGFTQEEFAKQLGISRVTLSRTLAGNPTIETLQNIAAALNVPLWKLIIEPEELPTGATIKCPNCGKNIKLKIE